MGQYAFDFVRFPVTRFTARTRPGAPIQRIVFARPVFSNITRRVACFTRRDRVERIGRLNIVFAVTRGTRGLTLITQSRRMNTRCKRGDIVALGAIYASGLGTMRKLIGIISDMTRDTLLLTMNRGGEHTLFYVEGNFLPSLDYRQVGITVT